MGFTNVLGGIEQPLFLVMDDNYVTNRYFDQNTTGWVSTGGTFTRGVQANAYGEYMANHVSVASLHSAYWEEDLGAAVTDKKFLASFRAQSDTTRDVLIEIIDDNDVVVVSAVETIGTSPKRILLYGDNIGTTLTQRIRLKIHSANSAVNGYIDFDHVFFSEVLQTISLPLSSVQGGEPDKLKFEKIVQGRNELWNGEIQEFGKKWRPHYMGRWDHMEVAEEIERQSIADSGRVFVLPHSDINWGFLGIWDNNIERRYAMNKYIGHKGSVPIKGIEYLLEFPALTAAEIVGIEQEI